MICGPVHQHAKQTPKRLKFHLVTVKLFLYCLKQCLNFTTFPYNKTTGSYVHKINCTNTIFIVFELQNNYNIPSLLVILSNHVLKCQFQVTAFSIFFVSWQTFLYCLQLSAIDSQNSVYSLTYIIIYNLVALT